MSKRNELAEIMSSTDATKKAELLSKAVVAITKQKQQLEEEHIRLLSEVARAHEELNGVQAEKQALQEKVKTLERRLRQTETEKPPTAAGNSAAPHFGQQVLKGLTSMVSGTEGSANMSSATPALLPEDVEKLITDNEQLHRQMYENKTKNGNVISELRKELNKRNEDRQRLQHEVDELRSLLETTTSACDRLNSLTSQQKAMLHVFEDLFRVSVTPSPALDSFPVRVSLTMPTSTSPVRNLDPEVKETLVDGLLLSWREHFQRLCGAVTVWISTLKRILPLSGRQGTFAPGRRTGSPSSAAITSVHLRSLLDDLEDLQQLHSAKRNKVIELFDQLWKLLKVKEAPEEAIGGTSGTKQAGTDSAEELDGSRMDEEDEPDRRGGPNRLSEPLRCDSEVLCCVGLELLEHLADWLRHIRVHFSVLWTASECVGGNPHEVPVHGNRRSAAQSPVNVGSTTTHEPINSRTSSQPNATTPGTERSALCESLPSSASTGLAMMEGVMRSLHQLLQRVWAEGSGSASTSFAGLPACDTMLVVLQLLWRSIYRLQPLIVPLSRVEEALAREASGCDSSHLRNVYHLLQGEVHQLLHSLLEESTSARAAVAEEQALEDLLHRYSAGKAYRSGERATPVMDPWGWNSGAVLTSDTPEEMIEELVERLEAADTQCVQQHHQLRCALFELALMREELLRMSSEASELRQTLTENNRQNEEEKEVLQEQIGLLSNQLAALGSTA